MILERWRRVLFYSAITWAKSSEIKIFFACWKKIQNCVAWFLANAATSHLKEQTPTWISIKIANEASSYYISSCSNHQPFSVIFSKQFFSSILCIFCSNHQPELKMKQEKWSNPPLVNWWLYTQTLSIEALYRGFMYFCLTYGQSQ